jgi:S1-C subfamily serine protease
VSTRNLERAVVGLVVSYQETDADRPWAKRKPATRWAQAVLVERGLLLTSAQMVAGATLVEVECLGRPPRAVARVVHQDRELNLALLAVDDESFVAGLVPLLFAPATPTAGALRTIRWSSQQFEVATLRVKKMSVSEVWFGRQRHAFLLGRCDLPDGGWAEPVVDDEDMLVGLTTGQNEHTAWVVPVEILADYVARATDPGGYTGVASLRFSWQWTMDKALAGWLGLGDAPRGVMIRSVPRGSTGDGVLRPRDVLLSLDGMEIDSRGYYDHPRWGSIEFTHLAVEGRRLGDVVPARILREAKELDVELVLRGYSNEVDLVPGRRGDEPPPYAVIGGLVFLELDGDYLRTWGNEWWSRAPARLVTAYQLLEGGQTPERRRVVLLATVLPSPWSIGYQSLRDVPVRSVGGARVDSIEDVVQAFAAAPGPTIRVEFEPNDDRSELWVDAASLPETTERILQDYGIPAAHRLSPRPPPALD